MYATPMQCTQASTFSVCYQTDVVFCRLRDVSIDVQSGTKQRRDFLYAITLLLFFTKASLWYALARCAVLEIPGASSDCPITRPFYVYNSMKEMAIYLDA